MNSAVNATTTQQGAIGGIHDRIDVESSDIGDDDIEHCLADLRGKFSHRATISRACHSRRGFEIDGRAHADVVVMRVKETARGAPAVSVQHFEEIIVGAEPAGSVQGLCRAGERDAVHVDAPIFPRADATRQLALVDQLAHESDSAQF